MTEAQRSRHGPVRHARVTNWQLWRLPAPAIATLLLIEITAVIATAVSLLGEPPVTNTLIRLGAIVVVAIAYGEACDRIERLRRYLGDNGVSPNHRSIWAVAALLIAPSGWACVAVAIMFGHVLVMGHRHRSIRPHRMIFTAAAMVLATWVGAEVGSLIFGDVISATDLRGALATLAAVAAYFVVDTVIIGVVVRLATGSGGPLELVRDRDATLFELGTLMLGILTAQLLLHSPWFAPIAVVCLVAMHRSSLVKQLQAAAETDLKTGLLNAAAWRQRAEEILRRTVREQERVALIVIDLDHFKLVNDKYGHLVGDQVLRTIGMLLKRESRGHDLVGRFGGEEFMILIDGRTAAAHAVDMATRLRARIAALEFPFGLRVTASLGVAHQVPDSPDLDTIVAAADAALYAAKAGGRDRVHAVAAG